MHAKPYINQLETDQSITVELHDDLFIPNEITIPNEKETTFMLVNKGKKEHTFTVEGLGIDVELKPGQQQSIRVIPQKSGTYELICRFHAQAGMVGKVIVE